MNTRAPQLEQQELLDRLVARLHEALGDRLQSVRLYGSWARGEAGEGSDLDTLVIVDQVDEEVRQQAGQARYQVMWEAGFEPFLSLVLVDLNSIKEAKSAFLRSVIEEGWSLYAQSK